MNSSAAKKMVNCYYASWAYYRQGLGKFIASDIDAEKCTHISYSFFGIQPSGEIMSLDSYLDFDLGKCTRYDVIN